MSRELKLHGLRTFIINLERRCDRREKIQKLAQALELNYTFITAIDGKYLYSCVGSKSEAVGDKQHVFELQWNATGSSDSIAESSQRMRHKVRIRGDRDEIERWTVLGCLLSHKLVLNRMCSEGLEYALILEDDGVLTGEVDEIRKRFSEGAEVITQRCPDWKVLYLGGVKGFQARGEKQAAPIPGAESYLVCGSNTYEAHAYIIRRSFVEEVCGKLDEGFAVDAALTSLSRRDNRPDDTHFFRFFPSLIRQKGVGRKKDSDITIGEAPPRKQRRTQQHDHAPSISPERSETPALVSEVPALVPQQSQPELPTWKLRSNQDGESLMIAEDEQPLRDATSEDIQQAIRRIANSIVDEGKPSPQRLPESFPSDAGSVMHRPPEVSSDTNMTWVCDKCTLENGLELSICEACENPRAEPHRKADEGLSKPTLVKQGDVKKIIVCRQCTLENSASDTTCQVCDAPLVADESIEGRATCDAALVADEPVEGERKDIIVCWQCTLENSSSDTKCRVCDAQLVVADALPAGGSSLPSTHRGGKCSETARQACLETGSSVEMLDDDIGEETLFCPQCTIKNLARDITCIVCNAQLVVEAPPEGSWVCQQCTLVNPPENERCAACRSSP